ncbi:hypothetical protein BCL57_001664 [Agromyces flavus]|uniref:Uncharacterized protein n=1 Tax=Agromyces flavus TaxID=589382 RepID=A0A1H1LBY2_9MICO|nr:hypothetical protein [Agromyces flavus]MCP2367510.1 hypothetical protein [Agromyces flavus]GGI45588.1 hypothetical protein GCM10010932_10300 [Agromyces flavus]SDR71937.1 hypothetical protein SAMN04489721_0075 [Agromyces flavus]
MTTTERWLALAEVYDGAGTPDLGKTPALRFQLVAGGPKSIGLPAYLGFLFYTPGNRGTGVFHGVGHAIAADHAGQPHELAGHASHAPVVKVAISLRTPGEVIGRVVFCDLDAQTGGPGREQVHFEGLVDGQVISTGSDSFSLTLYRTTLGN